MQPSSVYGTRIGLIYVMNRTQVEASDVVLGIFPVKSTPAYVLFDSSATNSFVFSIFAKKVGLEPTSRIEISVKTASSRLMACENMYEVVPVCICGTDFLEDLIQFDLEDIDIVLGMNWLGKYKP